MAITEYYSDLDFRLKKIPSTGDVNKVINSDAINQSLYSLFNTRRGERVFNPSYGTNIPRLLFDPLDSLTAKEISDEIQLSLTTWEGSRIRIISFDIVTNYDTSSYEIYIEYQIVNTQNVSSFQFTLQKV